MLHNTVKSAYIHIPFCKSKCKYCSFVSSENLENKTGYLYALLKEIDYYYKGESLETLYIGGGTPSIMSIEELSKIISKFRTTSNCEKTIELNPNDITSEYMLGLKKLGFNRISIGAQSFDDNILKAIGRRHSSIEIYNAVDIAKKAGFDNISLDFIYGLPNQTTDSFKNDILTALDLDIQHLSLYGLKIDENCYFYNHMPKNIPNDDIQADMYLLAGNITMDRGFNHYEISNYSKPGFESKHNTNYWECGYYYGFGLSAHGYINDIRYSNTSDIKNYLNAPIEHEYGKFLTEQEKLEEKIFLGFRLTKGINIEEINKEFCIDFEQKYKNILKKYLESKHIVKTTQGYKLSDDNKNNGFLISNLILSDFIE